MTERTLTIDTENLGGIPMNGSVEIIPTGTRSSDPTLVSAEHILYTIVDGALVRSTGAEDEDPPTIWSPGNYIINVYDANASRLESMPVAVEEDDSPISINELYRQANGAEPVVDDEPLYTGDDVGRLKFPEGTEGQVVGIGPGGVLIPTNAGSGDMARAVYDPGNIGANVYARINHTGTQAISTVTGLQAALDGKSDTGHGHAIVTTLTSGFMAASDKIKLDGIAVGATANATNAELRDRATHTGEQAIGTVTGLQDALNGKSDAVHTHSNATTDTAGFMSGADKSKLDGIATAATANETNAYLLSRTNHIDTQTLATISDAGGAAGMDVGTTAGTVAAGDHTHDAAAITSGVIEVARLGTGTPDGTKFLRGDGAWTVPSGGGSVGAAEMWYQTAAGANGQASVAQTWVTMLLNNLGPVNTANISLNASTGEFTFNDAGTYIIDAVTTSAACDETAVRLWDVTANNLVRVGHPLRAPNNYLVWLANHVRAVVEIAADAVLRVDQIAYIGRNGGFGEATGNYWTPNIVNVYTSVLIVRIA